DRPQEAVSLYEESRKIQEGLTTDHPRVSRYAAGLAATCNDLGVLQSGVNRLGDARSLLQRARELQEKLALDNPEVGEHERDLGVTWTNLGRLHLQEKHPSEAVKAFEKACQALEKLFRNDATPALRLALGRAHVNLGVTLIAVGKKEE